MAESFQNSDDTLRDWPKDKIQKILVEALNSYKKREKEKKKKSHFFFRKWLR